MNGPHGAVAVAVTGWVVIVLALVACEFAARRSRGRLPGILDVARALQQSTAGRWLLASFWLWAGWHLFVRRR